MCARLVQKMTFARFCIVCIIVNDCMYDSLRIHKCNYKCTTSQYIVQVHLHEKSKLAVKDRNSQLDETVLFLIMAHWLH